MQQIMARTKNAMRTTENIPVVLIAFILLIFLALLSSVIYVTVAG